MAIAWILPPASEYATEPAKSNGHPKQPYAGTRNAKQSAREMGMRTTFQPKSYLVPLLNAEFATRMAID